MVLRTALESLTRPYESEGCRLASSLGLLLLVLGVVLMIFGYSDLSSCFRLATPPQNTNFWDPTKEPDVTYHNFAESVIAFYVGIIIGTCGAVMLVGGDVVRLLGRSKVE